MELSTELKLEYNRAVEFIGAIIKYTTKKTRQVHWNTPDLEKDAQDILDFTPNDKVKEWLLHVDTNISHLFRNDFLFVTDEAYRIVDICLHLVLMENINTPLELIQALKVVDMDVMIAVVYKFYELDAPLDDEDDLRKAITENFSRETADSFLQLKKHPQQFRDRAVVVLKEFYHEFYEPFEKTIYDFMDTRLALHNELFDKDPVYFINTIGIGDYSKAIELHRSILIYVSYFLDVGVLYFTYEDTLVMCTGQTVEHKFENGKTQPSYASFFKALSDNKRIEILRLTSKRPWYNKELADHFNLSTATLSYHLNLLLDLRVLNFEPSIVNNRYYYTSNKEQIDELFDGALKYLTEKK